MFSVEQIEKAVDNSGLAFVEFESFEELTTCEQLLLLVNLLSDHPMFKDVMADSGDCYAQACEDLTDVLNDDISQWLSCQ